MSAEIWVAIITSLTSLAGIIITVMWGNKKNDERSKEQEKRSKEQTDLMLYRIDQLEKKQDKHNCLIERMYKVEKKEAVIEGEIEAIRQHIDDLHS